MLIDGPPGIGCPVIASLSDIDKGLVVVEPTLSGIHDLKRALKLLDHFEVESLVCINKYDLNHDNTKAIRGFCFERGIDVMGLIPFDLMVTKAMVVGQPIVEFDPDAAASQALRKMWSEVKGHLES